MIAKNCESMFQSSRFQAKELQNTWSGDYKRVTTMYLRERPELPRDQIYVLDKGGDFIFQPLSKTLCAEGTAFKSSSMQTAHFHNIYRSVSQIVLSCKDVNVFCNDCNHSLSASFVEYLQLISDKTAATVISSAFVSYPRHVVLLNTSPVRGELIINNGYTIISFLIVSISDFNKEKDDSIGDIIDADCQILPLDDDFRLTSTTEGR